MADEALSRSEHLARAARADTIGLARLERPPEHRPADTVAGITPASPQFKTAVISPALGSLKHLSVSYPSPHGEILAEYTVNAGETSANVTLPAGITGTLLWRGKNYPLAAGRNTLTLATSLQ